tara:strand:+ start:187 stop:483 length:297 start_codon:yes stop_codon:yes gene_type:complete
MELTIMSKRNRKLTPHVLRRIIAEERTRLNETLEMGLKHPSEAPKRTREVPAEKYADTLEDCCNWYQVCKLKEAKLVKQLKLVKEAKRRLKRRILKNI